MQIAGYSAVVTGAASGLGAATAARLAAAGAKVVGLDLAASIEKATAAGIPEGVTLVEADVRNEEQVAAAIAQASELGELRIAVNCAGVAWASRVLGRKGTHELKLFEDVIGINLVGSFNVLRLAAEAMSALEPLDEDGQRGVIINTASVAAFEGQVGQIAYAASKGGVHAMTISAARDLAQSGIRVMTIAPGTLETPMMAGITEEFREKLASSIPHPARLGRPEEYAQLAEMIITHDYLNGETIRLDGALRMGAR